MRYFKKNIKGFTLAELMICVTIMSFMMGVMIFNYGSFNDKLALSSAIQEIAISVRQAQTYGLNVKEVTVGGGQFNAAYGIYFDPSNSPSSYIVFADLNGNKKYDSGGSEAVETVPLRNGIRITDITTSDGCHSGSAQRTLHITFLRPNPDADINFVNGGGSIFCSSKANANIVLTSAQGAISSTTVEMTGQVYAQ
jgi:prepilin-type N-terminal cleavage/methylation domain-containing protein